MGSIRSSFLTVNIMNSKARLFEDLPFDLTPKGDHRRVLRALVQAEFDGQSCSRLSRSRFKQTGMILVKYNVTYLTAATLLICLVWIAQPFSPKVSAQDVVAHIMKVRTAQWDMILKNEGSVDQEIIVYLASGKKRLEFDGWIAIADHNQGKSMGLFSDNKLAVIGSVGKFASNTLESDHFEIMRRELRVAMADTKNNVEQLGRQLIDGQALVGFRFKSESFPTTIWADAETAFPVRIEIDAKDIQLLMRNHKFNIDLDPALFSLEVPHGYRVLDEDSPISAGGEKGFIQSLKMYAESSDGEFPDRLDEDGINESNYQYILHVTKRNMSNQVQRSAEDMAEDILLVVEGATFATGLAVDEKWDAHYAGAGVKIGTPNRPIFWYRPGKSDTYRVIYADLSARDTVQAPDFEDLENAATKLAKPKKLDAVGEAAAPVR